MIADRVVVVGGGIVGATIARALSPSREVTVLERDAPAAGATGVSAGLIAPTLFYGDRPEIARFAGEAIRSFDGTGAFSFTERPRVDLVTDASAARRRAERLANHGFPVRYVDRDDVEAEFPVLDLSGYPGAVRYGDTGWVDPHTFASTLLEDAENDGATLETGVEVHDLKVTDGTVTGVDATDRRYEADAVVLAAGWRTPALLPAETVIPVRPYRTQCLLLDPEPSLSDGFPLGRAASEGLYFRPDRRGHLLVGGGAHTCPDPTRAPKRVDESFVDSVAEFVPGLLEGIGDATVVDGWAGFDAATPDARPLIGRVPDGPCNLLVATGFNGLGVMMSPVAGPVVRAALGGEPAPFPTDCFDPDRFDADGQSFTFRSTADV